MTAGGAVPFRPVIRDAHCAPDLRDLMDQCLQEDPANRPDCGAIKNVIKKMNR